MIYISQNIKYDLQFHKFLRVKTQLFTQFSSLPAWNRYLKTSRVASKRSKQMYSLTDLQRNRLGPSIIYCGMRIKWINLSFFLSDYKHKQRHKRVYTKTNKKIKPNTLAQM
jgi:hypothetical protein